jgi:hypothetical protein
MNDPRHHPITMRHAPAHEYNLACRCQSCQTITARQAACKHEFIGIERLCVHCGAAKSHVEAMVPQKPQIPQVVPAGFAPTPVNSVSLERALELYLKESKRKALFQPQPVATTAPVAIGPTKGPHAQWNCPCDDPKCAGKRSYSDWCQRTIAELRAQWVTTGTPQSWT